MKAAPPAYEIIVLNDGVLEHYVFPSLPEALAAVYNNSGKKVFLSKDLADARTS